MQEILNHLTDGRTHLTGKCTDGKELYFSSFMTVWMRVPADLVCHINRSGRNNLAAVGTFIHEVFS
jgi:hypothetical protein